MLLVLLIVYPLALIAALAYMLELRPPRRLRPRSVRAGRPRSR
jgi:hypothetical protein